MKSSSKNNSTKYFSPFSKKLRTVAFGVVLCGGLITAPIVWSPGGEPLSPILSAVANAVQIAVWFYLSAILFQFYKRTQLREYILSTHSFWLAGITAYPITYLFGGILRLFGNAIPSNLYTLLTFIISGTWLVLAIAGKAFSQHRGNLLKVEIQSHSTLWKELLRMDYISIALLKFPKYY
jgi:hypothetical protein